MSLAGRNRCCCLFCSSCCCWCCFCSSSLFNFFSSCSLSILSTGDHNLGVVFVVVVVVVIVVVVWCSGKCLFFGGVFGGGSRDVKLQMSNGLLDFLIISLLFAGLLHWTSIKVTSVEACGGGGGTTTGGRVGLGLGVGRTEAGDGDRGCFWHSVHPKRKRVTASRGRNAYVSVICKNKQLQLYATGVSIKTVLCTKYYVNDDVYKFLHCTELPTKFSVWLSTLR